MAKKQKKKLDNEILPGVGSESDAGFSPIVKKESIPRKEKRRKQKSGKHLIDNILKSNKPKAGQLSLFESISEETQNKIISSGTSIEMVNRKGEGIKLSKGEYKAIVCLSKLLQDKSQTLDHSAPNYYVGDRYNPDEDLVTVKTDQGKIKLKSPRISITFYEIAHEFNGGKKVGGKTIKDVAEILYNLAENPEKRALLKYVRRESLGKGKEREYIIETYDSLIKIHGLQMTDFQDGKKIMVNKEYLVNLHPIFVDQIEKVFIELPIPQELIEAYGSPNVSEIAQKFIYELARAYSSGKNLPKDKDGNIIYTIGENTLYWKIAESYMNKKSGKPQRPQLLREYFDKSVETAKKLGLLIGYEEAKGKTGEKMLKFFISKNW